MAVLVLVLLRFLVRKRSSEATLRDVEAEEEAREVAGEGKGGAFYLGLSAVLVVGVVLGSELAVRGVGGLVAGIDLDETAFGMTVVGLVMSLEEVRLVLRPVQEDRVSIAVGNILGSLIFFSTGNVGMIALVGDLLLSPDVLSVYFPFLAAANGILVLFLWIGRVGPGAAMTLGSLYLAYWAVAYL